MARRRTTHNHAIDSPRPPAAVVMSPLPLSSLVRVAAVRRPVRLALRARHSQFRAQSSSVLSSVSSSSSSTSASVKAPTPPFSAAAAAAGSGPASAPKNAPKSAPIAAAATSTTASSTSTSTSIAATATSTTAAAAAATKTASAVPLWRRLGIITRAVDGYANSQRKRPYTTQLIGAFVIYLLADLSAQRIGGREHDPVRTGRTVLIGLVAAIPHFKFVFLSRNFNYASRSGSIATKVLVNQAVFAPTFNTYFFGAQALLSGEDLAATGQRLRDTLPPSLVNSFKVWPATMAIAFTFLPLEFRAIFSGVVAVGWQTYLSFLNRQAELKEHAKTHAMAVAAASASVASAAAGAEVAAAA
ncbi:Mpv17/PMP22 family protein [Purpureocillium lavendulum]|uniref:Mpv17/PMP22 family protein n=1 Tax=Purpureocillium lavendulum TaxID=1247861 RepID=A0AB34FSJ4_9HYPO|nr:Mpv17/PMP22 family protein [Purpureocillium lavendulum]